MFPDANHRRNDVSFLLMPRAGTNARDPPQFGFDVHAVTGIAAASHHVKLYVILVDAVHAFYVDGAGARAGIDLRLHVGDSPFRKGHVFLSANDRLVHPFDSPPIVAIQVP